MRLVPTRDYGSFLGLSLGRMAFGVSAISKVSEEPGRPQGSRRTRGWAREPDELSCSLQIRSDTSQILEENIPLLKAKVMEMRGIYAKVDQLEVSPG